MMYLIAAKQLMGFDVIEVAIGVIVLLAAIIKQIVEANKQAGKRAAQAPRPQGAPKPAPAPGGQQADPLRSQVEEFLRRAGQKNQGPEQQPTQRPISEIELLVDDGTRPGRSVDSNRQNTPRKTSPPPSDKRPARRPVAPKRRVTLAERAAVREEKRVGTLTDPQSQLGQRIIQEDKQFDEQLKAKFDHSVGTLGGAASAADPQATPAQQQNPAAQIAAMLINPEGVRQAVLLNEIMNRPSDRW